MDTGRLKILVLLVNLCVISVLSQIEVDPEMYPGEWKSLLNGDDLEGWRGNLDLWSVEEGVLYGKGEVDFNTFLISDSIFADFILEVDVMLVDGIGNSGIQYRSRVIDEENYIVSGYQADIGHNPKNDRWGKLVEEAGRADRQLHLSPPECPGSVKDNDWNQYQIIAEGNHMQHFLNGFQCVDYYDTSSTWASFEGILALQMHEGGPMEVRYQNMRIKELNVPVISVGILPEKKLSNRPENGLSNYVVDVLGRVQADPHAIFKTSSRVLLP